MLHGPIFCPRRKVVSAVESLNGYSQILEARADEMVSFG